MNNDYREMLKRLLDERKARNQRFSLRAFAQKIGLSHSTLSQVFKGERNLSLQTAKRIATTLKLSNEDKELFLLGVELANADEEEKKIIEGKILTLERFRTSSTMDTGTTQFLTDWLRFAIFSMAQMNWQEFSADYVSRMLKVPLADVEREIAGMIEKGVLTKDGRGKMSGDRQWFNPQSVEEILRLHREFLRRHGEAFIHDDDSNLISWSEAMPIALDQIPEAEEITRDYIRRMTGLIDKNRMRKGELKELYVLTVAFTNLLPSRWKKKA